MLPLSGNVQAGEDSCMRSKSPAFPKCASGYHPAPPPPADPAGAPKQGGVGLAPLRGTTPDYLFAGAELTRSCCIIYRGSFHQGTALAPSLPCCRGSKPAEHTHSSLPSFPGRRRGPLRRERQEQLLSPAPPRGSRHSAPHRAPSPRTPAPHLDPLHGRLQLQLLHQPLHGAQAAARRHTGAARKTEGMKPARQSDSGGLGSAPSAPGRGHGHSARSPRGTAPALGRTPLPLAVPCSGAGRGLGLLRGQETCWLQHGPKNKREGKETNKK